MSTNLLPCPFCGGESRLITGQHNLNDAQVSCLDCGMSGPNFDNDHLIGAFSTDPSADATEHWNTRIALSPASSESPMTITDEMVENGCRGMYGKGWDGPKEKQPGEPMKEVWRKLARACLVAALSPADGGKLCVNQ